MRVYEVLCLPNNAWIIAPGLVEQGTEVNTFIEPLAEWSNIQNLELQQMSNWRKLKRLNEQCFLASVTPFYTQGVSQTRASFLSWMRHKFLPLKAATSCFCNTQTWLLAKHCHEKTCAWTTPQFKTERRENQKQEPQEQKNQQIYI